MAKRRIKKPARRIFDLLGYAHSSGWCLVERTKPEASMLADYPLARKKDAVKRAAKRVRALAPSQLVVRCRSGRIEFERTYGGDPQRRVG